MSLAGSDLRGSEVSASRAVSTRLLSTFRVLKEEFSQVSAPSESSTLGGALGCAAFGKNESPCITERSCVCCSCLPPSHYIFSELFTSLAAAAAARCLDNSANITAMFNTDSAQLQNPHPGSDGGPRSLKRPLCPSGSGRKQEKQDRKKDGIISLTSRLFQGKSRLLLAGVTKAWRRRSDMYAHVLLFPIL